MDSLLRWLRSCPRCGRICGPVDGFCRFCLSEILSDSGVRLCRVKGFPFSCWSLLEWREHDEDVGLLVKSLKGPWTYKGYDFIACEFLRRLSEESDGGQGVISRDHVIVTPPSRWGLRDHAISFAEALGRRLELSVFSPFKSRGYKEQKRLRREERFKASFGCLEPLQAEGFIFVDDLITTGSTACAAWEALGRPSNFWVWSLACRPLQKLI